ncbi:CTP:molybdopterin cytidylyltransferase MocA, partial [Thermostichus sp. MS-CIW-21]
MANEPKLHALILAAGFSTRMGEPKAFLPWKDGQTLLSYQIFQWRQAGFQPWVVLGSQHMEWRVSRSLRGQRAYHYRQRYKGEKYTVIGA